MIEIIYNTYNVYNNNYYNSININTLLISIFNNRIYIKDDLNNEYENIIKIKNEKINNKNYKNKIKYNNNLDNIISFDIYKTIFSFFTDKKKLEIVRYNIRIQNRLDININNYRDFTRKYLKNEIIKKENNNDGKLEFKDENFNGKKNEERKLNKNDILIYEVERKHKLKGSNAEKFEKYKKKNKSKIYREYDCSTGFLEYEGEKLNGKWHGFGKKFYQGCLDYVGNYLNGKRNGKGEEYDKNGNLRFEGEYLNGIKWNGKGYDAKGYEEFKIKEGKGTIKEYNWYNGNLIYEGEYVNGIRNGKGKEFNDKNELILEGEYLNGKKLMVKEKNTYIVG